MNKLFPFFLAFAIIISSSVFALADSDDEARVFPLPLSDDFVYESLQSGDALRAVEYTTTDIYNLLYSALRGENYLSIYSLPQIASYTDRIAQTLYGSGQSVPSTSLYTLTNNILSSLTYYDDGVPSGVGGLLGEIMYDTIDNKNYLANISSKSSSIDSKLDRWKWLSAPISYYGASLDLNTSYISSATSYYGACFQYYFPEGQYANSPCIIRIPLPLYNWNISTDSLSLSYDLVSVYQGDSYIQTSKPNYFFEQCYYGTYLYLYDFDIIPNSRYTFIVTSPEVNTIYPLSSPSISYISFDSDEFQLMKIANSTGSLSDDLSAIRQVVASPDKVQAEQAQQSVESQVLDDFTGQGSESMSLSDVGGVKNVSSNAKQFLGTGSSGSNALSVFNVNGQGLWQWFSQTTADNLDSTPITRDSNGFLSIYDYNMQQYYDGLGGDDLAR